MSARPLATSPTAVYGALSRRQYDLVARVWNGEDVRFYSKGVHPLSAHALMRRRVLDCEAATCRFLLLPAKGVLPRGQRKTWPGDVR